MRESKVVSIDEIRPNPYQPRVEFDDEALMELSQSIRENGLIHPITVRKENDGYEIVAGERRYRAMKIAGMLDIPVIVIDADEVQMAEMALVENIQRENLSAIEEAKAQVGEHFTVKQLEKLRKSLKQKLEKLQGTDRKDDVVTFEQLGVDRLFVDESQNYKNLFLYTKMRNVAGLSTSEAQKSSDMFGKCRYLDEITGGRGVIFATGTPISNSMTEMYTLMRYLQYNTLQQKGLTHFDAWASTFGETTTAIELAPEGYTLIGR